MKRILNWVISLSAIVVGVLLAIANRQSVTLSLDPFSQNMPALSVGLPLYIVIFFFLFIGIIIGGTSTWLSASRARKAARALKRHKKQEEKNRDIINLPVTDQ